MFRFFFVLCFVQKYCWALLLPPPIKCKLFYSRTELIFRFSFWGTKYPRTTYRGFSPGPNRGNSVPKSLAPVELRFAKFLDVAVGTCSIVKSGLRLSRNSTYTVIQNYRLSHGDNQRSMHCVGWLGWVERCYLCAFHYHLSNIIRK